MFHAERGAGSLKELKRRRELSSKVVISQLHAWMIETLAQPSTLPKGELSKAINYALKLWKGLTLFVEHPEIPLSNNEAERGVRQPVMGRNNFLGSRTIDGADLAALFYTIIEFCKHIQLNPGVYMREMLRRNWRGETC